MPPRSPEGCSVQIGRTRKRASGRGRLFSQLVLLAREVALQTVEQEVGGSSATNCTKKS